VSARASAALLVLLLASVPLPAADARAQEDLLRQLPPLRTYVLGLIRRGAAWTPERSARTDSLQRGHMANMQRRFEEGWLQGAGPMLDGGDLRGIFIFSVDSIAHARSLAATDPAVAAGRLRVDYHRWVTFAGVSDDYRRRHAAGERDSMVRKTFVLLRRGPTPAGTPEAEEALQRAHLQNMVKLVKDGHLVLTGPLLDEADEVGVYVFETADTAEARRWCDTDPKVRSGHLRAEIHPWMVARGVVPGH
jgi:uncharacterized protein YciI